MEEDDRNRSTKTDSTSPSLPVTPGTVVPARQTTVPPSESVPPPYPPLVAAVVLPNRTRKPRTCVFNDAIPWYICPDVGTCEHRTPQEETNVLWEIAKEHWGDCLANNLKWVNGNTLPLRKGKTGNCLDVHCHYWNLPHPCRWRAQVVRESDLPYLTIRIGLVAHTNHDILAPGEKPISQALACSLESPGDFTNKTSRMVASVKRRKISLTSDAATSYARKLRRLQVKYAKSGLQDDSTVATYGQIAEKTAQYSRDKFADFMEHTFYLLGNRFIVEASRKRFAALFSTENLVLNLYRQLKLTGHYVLFVDASHKYTTEKWPLFPIKVVCPMSQVSHIVAYGVISNDDSESHLFLFQSLKRELESIINDRLDKGCTHI